VARASALRGLASGRVWCALSVGGRAVLARKAGEAVPNEDALCAAEGGARVLLAVADSHYGHAASHVLIERVDAALVARAAAGLDAVPGDVDELCRMVAACADPAPGRTWRGRTLALAPLARRCETTLVVAVVDRDARAVFGVSIGDSSAVTLGDTSGARWLTRATQVYATPTDGTTLARARLATFAAPVAPGALVVVFSDGVNECEYGSPATSIGTRHLEALWRSSAGSCERFVGGLAALALTGVDGHPGGEDNLAIAAALV